MPLFLKGISGRNCYVLARLGTLLTILEPIQGQGGTDFDHYPSLQIALQVLPLDFSAG